MLLSFNHAQNVLIVCQIQIPVSSTMFLLFKEIVVIFGLTFDKLDLMVIKQTLDFGIN